MAETWTQFLTTLGVALASALVFVLVVHLVVRLLARRSVWAGALLRRARVPFRLFVLAATLSAVVANARPEDVSEAWWDRVGLVCRLFTIGSGAAAGALPDVSTGGAVEPAPDERPQVLKERE